MRKVAQACLRVVWGKACCVWLKLFYWLEGQPYFCHPSHQALETKFNIRTIMELDAVADHLAHLSRTERVFLFQGGMGAGKTTLIKRLCENLGVEDGTGSPTFSIVNEYEGKDGPIYHFDLYRIEREEELFDLGIEEYLRSGYLCLVEWPELAPSLYNEPHVNIRIIEDDGLRQITITTPA